MVTFNANIQSKHPPEIVFDYLSAFSNAAQWDPGISAGRPLGNDPVSKGAMFRLDFNLLGRSVELIYEITEYDRPNHFIVAANGGTFLSRDRITISASETGSIVNYEATLEFFGIAKLLTPVWTIVFNNIGRNAAKGLADWLERDKLIGIAERQNDEC